MLELPHPILTNEDLAKLRARDIMHQREAADAADAVPVAEGGAGLKAALDELCRQASLAVLNGHGF